MSARVVLRCYGCNVKMARVYEQPEAAPGEHSYPTDHGVVVFSGPSYPVHGNEHRSCPPVLPPEDNPYLADALERSRSAGGSTVTIKVPAWVGGAAVKHVDRCQTEPSE